MLQHSSLYKSKGEKPCIKMVSNSGNNSAKLALFSKIWLFVLLFHSGCFLAKRFLGRSNFWRRRKLKRAKYMYCIGKYIKKDILHSAIKIWNHRIYIHLPFGWRGFCVWRKFALTKRNLVNADLKNGKYKKKNSLNAIFPFIK